MLQKLLAIAVLACGAFSFWKSTQISDVFVGLIVPDVIDLGTLVPNQTTSKTVNLRNDSRFPIEILAVSTSCSCSSGELSHSLIDPGGTATMDVSVNLEKPGTSKNLISVVYHFEKSSTVHQASIAVVATIPVTTDIPDSVGNVSPFFNASVEGTPNTE